MGVGAVRVIAGTARGRPLRSPRSGATRPTSDRVREAVFSMLESLHAVGGKSVLDLFAGSGALGIESVSRGAERAVLVDSSSEAVAVIRANAAVLGPDAGRVEVVRSDAERYLRGAPGRFGRFGRFDLVLADPPYAYDGWPDLLALLAPVTGLLVVETGSPWDPGAGWETVKVKSYGGTVVSIARPTPIDPLVGGEEGES